MHGAPDLLRHLGRLRRDDGACRRRHLDVTDKFPERGRRVLGGLVGDVQVRNGPLEHDRVKVPVIERERPVSQAAGS